MNTDSMIQVKVGHKAVKLVFLPLRLCSGLVPNGFDLKIVPDGRFVHVGPVN